MKKLFAALILLALPVVVLFAIYRQAVAPYAEEKIIEIPRGASTMRIGEILEQAGLLRSPLQALVWRGLHPRAKLQAGEYVFRKETTVDAILSRIARGDVYFALVTIPEGASIYDISRILETQKIVPAGEFIAAARKPDLIRDLDPEAPSLEGYLFPSTYRLPRKVTAQMMCQRLTAQFREVWGKLGAKVGPHRVVTLASLVEKESAAPEERPRIAGLYMNRLARGMKLECDPTVIYAALVEDRYRGTIYRSDLASQNPYNTYQHTGLPPGPIANPGVESLKAALAPAKTDEIFFVAEPGGTGHHKFSRTLEEHNRAVAAYRRGQKR
jgi:UPF0755 protein